jgi:hypothetical protein
MILLSALISSSAACLRLFGVPFLRESREILACLHARKLAMYDDEHLRDYLFCGGFILCDIARHHERNQ